MRKSLILCLGAGCLGFAGALMIRPAVAQPQKTVSTVVAMTSHEIPFAGDTIYHHFFRTWSDGFMEWTCRRINFNNGTVFWGNWENIEDVTWPPFCP